MVIFVDEFEAEHKAEAADGLDEGRIDVFETSAESLTGIGDLGGICELGVEIEGSEGHGAADGVSEEGGGVDSFAGGGWPGVHDLGAGDAGGERVAGGEAFAEADDVGVEVEVFAGEEFAGAIEAGENLVEDEEGVELVAEVPEAFEEVWVSDAFSAAALDGFDEDGAGIALGEGFFDGGEGGGDGGVLWGEGIG